MKIILSLLQNISIINIFFLILYKQSQIKNSIYNIALGSWKIYFY